MNMVGYEAMRSYDAIEMVQGIMMEPLEFAYCAFFIYYYVGWSILSGAAVWIVRYLVMSYLNEDRHDFHTKMHEMADKRLQKTTESFLNIKLLKLQAWEDKFQEQITKEYY